FPPRPRRPPWADAAEKQTRLSGFPERETARSETGPRPGIPAQTKSLGQNESPAPAAVAPAVTLRPERNATPSQAEIRRPGKSTTSPPAQTGAHARNNLLQNHKGRQAEYCSTRARSISRRKAV